jgi:hypothetical protein
MAPSFFFSGQPKGGCGKQGFGSVEPYQDLAEVAKKIAGKGLTAGRITLKHQRVSFWGLKVQS